MDVVLFGRAGGGTSLAAGRRTTINGKRFRIPRYEGGGEESDEKLHMFLSAPSRCFSSLLYV